MLVAFAVALFGLVVLFKIGNIGTTLLWNLSGEGSWLLPLVVVAALIDSINPCAFSILLLTIAFLLSINKLRSNILAIGGAYVLGIFVVYVLIGLGLLETLHLFDTPHFMGKLGATLLILLGVINILNYVFPGFPIKLKIPDAAHHKMAEFMNRASLPAAFALGALVGVCEFPCTGGPYLMVIGLLHDQGTYLKGVAYLFFYNLIFVLPLVVILFIASDKLLAERVSAWQRKEGSTMRIGVGVAMVALGILVFLM